jgi:hypothetical protein
MGLSFVARFFKPNTRKQFKEANKQLVEQVKTEFGDDAAIAFKATFSSRSSLGSPLTAGSVRAFIAGYYLPPDIQKGFIDTLNDPEQLKKMPTAMQHHNWLGDTDGPDISEQLYLDVHRTDYSLLDSQGRKSPLYDRVQNNHLSEEAPKFIPEKRAALEKFVDFIGDKDKAFKISQFTNQQISLAPLRALTSTPNGPFKLPSHGAGLPEGGIKTSYNFSKSENGDVILRFQVNQNPSLLKTTNKEIDLDNKKSFINFDYTLTFHFDNENNLSIKSGPIGYKSHLEEAAD